MSATEGADRQESGGLGRRVAATAVLLLSLVGLAVPGAVAWWGARTGANASDTEEVGVNRLGAATLDIEIGRDEAVLGARNLAPGDVVPGEIEIVNAGDLPLLYSVSVVTDGGSLGRWLLLDAWFTRGSCTAAPGPDDDVTLSGGPLAATTLQLTGDPATGPDDGDRRLAPGQGERLCLRAVLPLDAPNEAQGTDLGLDVVVDAEHDVAATDDVEDGEGDDGDLQPRRGSQEGEVG